MRKEIKLEAYIKDALAEQFGGALDMFEKTLRDCPPEVWTGRMWSDPSMPAELSEFWYVAYHALFWLDFYTSGADPGFTPPPPFTLSELDPAGQLPDRVYPPAELLGYLAHGRAKYLQAVRGLTDGEAARACRFGWGEMSYLALLIDILRHTQEHGAQLAMYLGQRAGRDARWVTRGNGLGPQDRVK